MQMYTNTSELVYDVPRTADGNKPIYANISRPVCDVPEGCHKLSESIRSVFNFDTGLIKNTWSTSPPTSYWTSCESFPPPPTQAELERLSSGAFDSGELNEVLTEGNRFLSMANDVVELSKERCSVLSSRKYRIAGSLCGVLGLGFAAGYFVFGQFTGNQSKDTMLNLPFSPLQPSILTKLLS